MMVVTSRAIRPPVSLSLISRSRISPDLALSAPAAITLLLCVALVLVPTGPGPVSRSPAARHMAAVRMFPVLLAVNRVSVGSRNATILER